MKRIHLLITSALCAAAIIVLGIPCQIRQLIGIPCPTCGMTRAALLALGGNFGAAFRMHPLFWLMPFLFAAIFFIKNRRLQRDLLIFFAVLLFAVWVIRMIIFFPDTVPMDFNRNAVLIQIFERILKK